MTRQGIFISYRHDDSSSAAQRLREHLERVIDPKTVFLDTESIKHGDNFEEAIRKALTQVRVLLVIIGKRWLAVKDEHERRRLDAEDDWVRLEVASALADDSIAVIPVLVDGCRDVPARNALPEPLRRLSDHRAIDLRTGSFQKDLGELVARLVELGLSLHGASLPPAPPSAPVAAPRAENDAPSIVVPRTPHPFPLGTSDRTARLRRLAPSVIGFLAGIGATLAALTLWQAHLSREATPRPTPTPISSLAWPPASPSNECKLTLASIGLKDNFDEPSVGADGAAGADQCPRGNRDCEGYAALVSAYTSKQSNVTIIQKAYRHEWMKNHLAEFLSGDEAPDVLVWSAGTNVKPYKNSLALIEQTPAWFDEAMDYVGTRVKENFHFVPFKTYVWAFYYLKNTWPESWDEPKTFDALLARAKLMRKRGLEPIAFGNVHGWPALGYLDAINMRVAGFTCHQKLMERTADWSPLGVKRDGCNGISATLTEWQRLVPYFSAGWYSTSYRDAARQLADQKAGMFFIGGFFAEELRADLLSQLRVFEFPYTSKDFRGVDAPIDGFVFPMKAKERRPARCDKPMREFIEFLRSKEAYRAYDAKNPGSSLSVLKGMNYTLEVQKAALGILELNDKDHRVGGFFDREFKIDAPNPTQVPAAPQDPVGEVVIPELHAFLISSAGKEISPSSILLGVQKKLPPVP